MEAAGKRVYDTYNKIRLTLFIRSYVGNSISNYLITKYKIEDRLTKFQLHERFFSKKAIPEISKLSRALNLNYQLLLRFVMFNSKQRLNPKIKTNEKIKAYLAIENEIIFLTAAKSDKDNRVNEDYERATLSPAIERATGDSLRNIDDDLIFQKQLNKLQKDYRRWYYETAYKYKLPTPRILAFIMRLISF